MDIFTEDTIINKITQLMRGDELKLDGKRIILGTDKEGMKYSLAIIAMNETECKEQLLPFDISFSEFINMLGNL